MILRPADKRRKGVVAILALLLLVPILAMVAFAVDMGYVVTAKSELQNAADAAALAGAQQMMDPFVQWSIPTLTTTQKTSILSAATSSATQAAKNYASYNRAGGVNIKLQDSDIEFGYTNSQGVYTAPPLSSTVFPNTIKVTARRDATGGANSNGSLGLFFGTAVGKSSVDLKATAAATIYTSMVTNFSGGAGGPLLPLAVNANDWYTYFPLSGLPPTGLNLNLAPNGLPQLQIYPSISGSGSGNGLLSLNGSAASSTGYYSGSNGWIQGGASSVDLAGLQGSGDLPLPTTTSWHGGPGMKSTLISDFQAVVGAARYLALYDSTSGNGNNMTYHVKGFVGVTITAASGNGNNMTIYAQPTAIRAANQITGTGVPAGSDPTQTTFTFIPPKLSQ